jgi:hypothetical protein
LPIKEIRIDQGRMHAEKRSNHVRSPLIDEKRALRAGARHAPSAARQAGATRRAGVKG